MKQRHIILIPTSNSNAARLLITCSCTNCLMPTQTETTATFHCKQLSCNSLHSAARAEMRLVYLDPDGTNFNTARLSTSVSLQEDLSTLQRTKIQRQKPLIHRRQWGCCAASERVTVADTASSSLSKTQQTEAINKEKPVVIQMLCRDGRILWSDQPGG